MLKVYFFISLFCFLFIFFPRFFDCQFSLPGTVTGIILASAAFFRKSSHLPCYPLLIFCNYVVRWSCRKLLFTFLFCFVSILHMRVFVFLHLPLFLPVCCYCFVFCLISSSSPLTPRGFFFLFCIPPHKTKKDNDPCCIRLEQRRYVCFAFYLSRTGLVIDRL